MEKPTLLIKYIYRYTFYLSLVSIIFLVLFSSKIPRGSDQYWYIADSTSVSKGVFTTNHVYPNSYKTDSQKLRPFVQNRPIVYFAGLLVYIGFDPVSAYQIINILALVGTLRILAMLLKIANVSWANRYLVYSLYIAIPAVTFSLFQPLTQLFDTFIFTSVVLLLIKTKKLIGSKDLYSRICIFALAVILSAVLILQRGDFILFILALSFLVFACEFDDSRVQVTYWEAGKIVFLYVITMLAVVQWSPLPGHLGNVLPSRAYFYVGIPGTDWDNMTLYFADPNNFHSLLFRDLIHVKFTNFSSELSNLHPLQTPISAIIFAGLCFFCYSLLVGREVFLSFLMMVILLMLLALVIGFQYQYRYPMFLLPFLFFAFFFVQRKLRILKISLVLRLGILSSLLIVAIGTTAYGVVRQRVEGEDFRLMIENLPSKHECNGNALVAYTNGSTKWGYIFPEATIFSVTGSTIYRKHWHDINLIIDKNNIIKQADPEIFDNFSEPYLLTGGWNIYCRYR
jgi:hypothetical protein